MIKLKRKILSIKNLVILGAIFFVLPFSLLASQRWLVGEVFTSSS